MDTTTRDFMLQRDDDDKLEPRYAWNATILNTFMITITTTIIIIIVISWTIFLYSHC